MNEWKESPEEMEDPGKWWNNIQNGGGGEGEREITPYLEVQIVLMKSLVPFW